MTKDKKFIVGFDLDGVIASPLFDGIAINIRILKEHLLRLLGRERDYFYPQSKIERWAWVRLNRLREPTVTAAGLSNLKNTGQVSIFLITSRFKFLEEETYRWLQRYHLESVFDKIYINNTNLSPVDFKSKILNENSIDYYLDDDLEILEGLRGKVKTRIYRLGKPGRRDSGIEGVKSVADFIEMRTTRMTDARPQGILKLQELLED